MTTLSKTDIENLEDMVQNMGLISTFKGHGRAMRKMIDEGMVTKHVWNGSYVWQITHIGRMSVN